MRKVFLDELPRKNRNINWKKSVGCIVKFIYDDIEGEFKIINYNTQNRKVSLLYDNELISTHTNNLIYAKISKVLDINNQNFRYEIGDIFDDLILIDNKIKIKNGALDTIEKQKWYKYHCNICGNEDWITERNVTLGNRCNVCCNKKVLKGYNDIATTDPWMISLGMSREDAETHTYGSRDKIEVICPDCGREKEIEVNRIYNKKSISCHCGDGISYPEKFLISLLNQSNIKYVKEYKPKWSNNKRYDFYLIDYDIIIETHGSQHYEKNNGFNLYGNRNFEEEKTNDDYKKQLALKNGINDYIILDCRKSDMKFIKNSILNSKLNNMFDLSKIDWLKCEEFALSNRVKEVCDYWNQKEEKETTTDLSNRFNLNKTTICNYLKQGAKLGWCGYDPNEEIKKTILKNSDFKKKPVEIFKDGESLGIFPSCTELAKQSEGLFNVKLLNGSISAVCLGKNPKYKGFTFKYVEGGENGAS